MPQERILRDNCPDCGVAIGENHLTNCDIERCPKCGLQLLSCDCSNEALDGVTWIPWTGEFPGVAEARALGWYSKLIPGSGWVSCDPSDPDATEDLNRLYSECVWDSTKQVWRLPIRAKSPRRRQKNRRCKLCGEKPSMAFIWTLVGLRCPCRKRFAAFTSFAKARKHWNQANRP